MLYQGEYHLFFKDYSYMVIEGYIHWAYDTLFAGLQGSPIQLTGCITIDMVVPVWCSCYEYILGPISLLLGTQIDSWWFDDGIQSFHVGWWTWLIRRPYYISLSCMGLIQRVYKWHINILGYPLCRYVHIHDQFVAITGEYCIFRDKGICSVFF